MDCSTVRVRMSAALDGELDAAERVALEAHLAQCCACANEMEAMQLLSRSLAVSGAKRAPPALRQRVRADLAREVGQAGNKRTIPLHVSVRTLVLAASIVGAVLLAGAVGYHLGGQGSSDGLLRRDAVAAHIRSLLQDTQIQVASSDTHTVKPWFAGRVDASPAVRDLASDGFALLGGRLDYVGARRVGVLVYKQRQHLVSVYFWPSSQSDELAEAVRQNGYNLLQWTVSGITYLAVSDLNIGDMQRLSRLL